MEESPKKRLSSSKLAILFSLVILYSGVAEAQIMRTIVAGATGGVVAGAIMGSMAKKETSPAVTNTKEVLRVMCYTNSHRVINTPNGRMRIYGSKNALLIDVPKNSQYIIKPTSGLEYCDL